MTDRNYDVGYGKPPQHTRFVKGQSGCRSGGRKAPKSLSDQLDRILSEKVTVTESGKSQRMTIEDVFLRQLVNRAVSGESQASRALLGYLDKRQQRPDTGGTNATEEFLIAELLRMTERDEEVHDDGPA